MLHVLKHVLHIITAQIHFCSLDDTFHYVNDATEIPLRLKMIYLMTHIDPNLNPSYIFWLLHELHARDEICEIFGKL